MVLNFLGDDPISDEIEIDKEYARRYEHNNRREELQRLQELQKRGVVDSDSESSESEPDLFNDDDDIKKYMQVLVKVKNQDPVIKQKDAKLFESEDEESEESGGSKKEKKRKPKYLKDVIAEKLLEQGGEDEDEELGSRVRPGGKSYNEEQEELRKKFLDVAEREFDDDNEDLIKEKKKRGEEEGDGGNEEIKKISDDYFGEDEGLDEKEKFLKKFIVEKMWLGKDEPRMDDLDELSEDEEEVWDQQIYEKEFNFRYQEDAGDRILGHPRVIEGTVRKKKKSREEQRKRKQERMDEAGRRNREELKHMKNLKKKEIFEKLEKIRAIGGLAEGEACALDVDDLEDDFDPEEYDKKMKKTFDDDYYNAEDADFVNEEDDEDGDIEKPDFDKEDELLGLPKDWDVCGTSDGFAAIREKVLKSKRGSIDVEDEEHGENDEDEHGNDDDYIDSNDNKSDLEGEEQPEEGNRKRKRKISLREKLALAKDMDEYYGMDYEGTIGELKTRFKYAPVPPQRFGLSAKNIIMMDDKDLNQYVPLKKIAPYTETQWKVPKKLRNQMKMKNKLIEEEVRSNYGKAPKNHGPKGSRTLEPVSEEEERLQVEEINGDVGEPSKKRKRKDRMKEVKPSEQRRKAYGIGDPQPKKKKKEERELIQ